MFLNPVNLKQSMIMFKQHNFDVSLEPQPSCIRKWHQWQYYRQLIWLKIAFLLHSTSQQFICNFLYGIKNQQVYHKLIPIGPTINKFFEGNNSYFISTACYIPTFTEIYITNSNYKIKTVYCSVFTKHERCLVSLEERSHFHLLRFD